MIDTKNPHVLYFADICRATTMPYLLALDYATLNMVKSGMVQVQANRGICDCFLIWREAGKLHFRRDSYKRVAGTSNTPHRVSVVCVNKTFAFADLPPLENVTPFDLALAKDGYPIEDTNGNPLKFIAHVPDAHVLSQVVYMDQDGDVKTCTTAGYHSGHRMVKMKGPVTQTHYANVYRYPNGRVRVGHLFASEEVAKQKRNIVPSNFVYLATIKVEWEE